MTTTIDIKALAKEIAKSHGVSEICDKCEFLIGECDPDVYEYYIIEEGVEDGFLGYEDWAFDIRVTPDVRYNVYGGYVGCDYCDCDHVVEEIRGIDDVSAYSVTFHDREGNFYELNEKQLEELQNELEDAIYEA